MAYPKEFDELIENFYEIERIVYALEKEPRTYQTDTLLYSGEAHTLKFIAEHEGINQKALSEAMYRTKGATSIMIEKLVQKGLVIKSSGRGDQRKNTLFLTEKGWQVHENHLKYDSHRLADWFENINLTQEQLVTTNQVIHACLEYYKNHLTKKESD